MSAASMPSNASQAVDYDPFAGGELARVVPTTEPQREVWLADRLGRDASLAFNESVSLRLRGRLVADALQAALQGLIERHDALRANLGPDGETLCIHVQAELVLPFHDFSSLAAAARTKAIEVQLRQAVETPFALDQELLLRAELLRLDDDEHLLLLTAHHIVCDGWSWWVIVRELGALYARQLGVDTEPLPAADSFADYAIAEAIHPGGAVHEADEAYWLSRFTDGAPILDLPLDRTRPPRRGFASLREDYTLDAALVAGLRQMGARRGASLFATLLGGFADVLSRLAAQSQVVIGIPAAGQSIDGHGHLVGHCVNLLPLRFDIDPAQTFAQMLDATQETLLDALEHQRYTFGTLLKKLRIARDPSRLPLISVIFNIDQALDSESTDFPGLTLDFACNPRSYENFELFINAVQAQGELRLECQYNKDLFDAATVKRWLTAYEALLRAAVEHTELSLANLPLVSAAARADLIALQPALTPYDGHMRAHEFFESQADRAPQRIAVRAGEKTLTYGELEARSNRIAQLLRARGVRRGSLVGLALDRDTDMVAAVLAVLKSGAGYVPLDPAFPDERLAFMVGDAGLAALVTQREHAGRFDLRGRPMLVLDALEAELDATSNRRIGRDEDAAQPDSVAYVIYTSGSTGRPKGVLVPHRTTANFIPAMQREPGISADDRLLSVTTLSFDIAFMELMLPLSVGAEIVVANRDQQRDGAALRALLECSQCNFMQATPAGWRLLVESGWQGHPGFKAVTGGEPLALDLAEALLTRCGEVWNGYGPTETTIYSTYWQVQNPRAGIVIGRPVANTQVWVLDEQRQLCPIGVPGELWIGGDGVAAGYLGRPELTAARFLDDPYSSKPGARLYRTGDRGRWLANGTIEHLGRVDFQIKVRGYRIEPGEIENTLAAHPNVSRAVVITREDRPGDVRLVAYVVAQPGAKVDEGALNAYIKQSLPEYMIPQHMVALDAIPQLPNGKIDRKSLPAPDVDSQRTQLFVAPRNDLERTIAAAMAQVLGLQQIGIDDDFFALGGHSLLAAQLTSRLNRELGVSLSLRALFDGPTVARLAVILNGPDVAVASPRLPIVRLADQDRAPLSLMQERLWLLEEFNPGRLTYNTPSAHRLVGPLNLAVFDRAFQELTHRQSILRTSIMHAGDEAVQVVHERIDTGLLPLVDLTHLPQDEREAELTRRLQALIEVSFDLSRAPLFHARLFKLDAQLHVLFFMPHHIIWDGWSFDLLYADIAAIYGAYLEGREPDLPVLPVSYGDYAAWHREWVKGPEYARQLEFWRDRLSRPSTTGEGPRALPTDKPRKPGMTGQGRSRKVVVDQALTDQLHGVAKQTDATVFVILLTAYLALLNRVTGLNDLVVGTPVRGRNCDEVEGVMGYFTNLLPLRVEIDPATPFPEAVRRVKDAVLDSFAHPDIRLEDLMRELSGRSVGGAAMLYHSLFSFQDIRDRIVQWGNVEHVRMPLFQPGATEDLGLWFVEDEFGLSGGLIYNADILFEDTATALHERYMDTLRALVGDPTQALGALTCFEHDERPMLIGQGPSPAEPVPAANDVHVETTVISPRNVGPLEAQVMAIWCDLLGCDQVSLDDDFFALGGNSLQAVHLFHRMRRSTGVNLPLATLLTAPTVRTLTAAYRAAKNPGAVAAGSAAADADPWAPLVLLRPGSAPHPLFLMHAIGGNVLNYIPLADAMPPDMPVYGLQALGLDGRTAPLTRIEDMAARYVLEIRNVQPSGPYHLAGGSMGGIIAYEMAQQLTAAGEQIALLGLFDTSAQFSEECQLEATGKWSRRLRNLRQHWQGRTLRHRIGHAGVFVQQRVAMRVARWRAALMRLVGAELPHEVRYVEIEASHLRAYLQYVTRPYAGSLLLFRAEIQPDERDTDPTLGWDAMVDAVEVTTIPGDHYGVVEAPELVAGLRRAFAAATQTEVRRANEPPRITIKETTGDAKVTIATPPSVAEA